MNRNGWFALSIIACFVCDFQALAVAPTDFEMLQKHLVSVITKIRAGGQATHEENERIRAADPSVALEALLAFENDESSEARRYVYYREEELLFESPSTDVRREIIERLVRAICLDPDDTVADSLYSIGPNDWGADDFTGQAKEWIRAHLQNRNPRTDAILLSGLADLQDQIPRLKELRAEDDDYEVAIAQDADARTYVNIVNGWHARLALARLGSLEDIAHCIEKIEAAPDRFIQGRMLLKYYGYIRQPEVIPILQQHLERNDPLDEGMTPAGYYAQKILAEIVEGFPAQADLATARAWMQAQTEFKIKR